MSEDLLIIDELPELNLETLPVVPTTKQKDADLYDKWVKSKSKQDLANLLKVLNPLIQKEVNRASGSLPKAVLEAEAKKWAIEAIKKFNPNSGTVLSTYVTHYLQKVRRLNYEHQNMSRIPESRHLEYGTFKNSLETLRDQLAREPTDTELASHLNWKPFAVKKFKGMLYEDHFESGSDKPSEASKFDFEKTKFDYIQGHLDDQEKIIMKSLTASDKKRKSSAELAAELGVNQNRLSYLKTKMKKKIRTIQNELGEWD